MIVLKARAGEHTQAAVAKLHNALATAVFQRPRSRALQWLAPLSRARNGALLRHFLACVTLAHSDFNGEADALGVGKGTDERAQLLALRGQLGGGVLVHCLMLRHRVAYGTNERCAVPLHVTGPHRIAHYHPHNLPVYISAAVFAKAVASAIIGR